MTKIFKIDTNKEGVHSVSVYDTKKEAQAKGNSGHIVGALEDLNDNFALTTSMMRDVYNVLNPDKQVSRFSDRESACRRLWASLQASAGETPEKAAAGPKAVAGKAKAKPKATKAPKEKKASGGPRKGSRREVSVSIPKGTENPYRVATASHKAFEIAEANPGLTFNQLVAKGGRANTLAEMMREGLLKPTKG